MPFSMGPALTWETGKAMVHRSLRFRFLLTMGKAAFRLYILCCVLVVSFLLFIGFNVFIIESDNKFAPSA